MVRLRQYRSHRKLNLVDYFLELICVQAIPQMHLYPNQHLLGPKVHRLQVDHLLHMPVRVNRRHYLSHDRRGYTDSPSSRLRDS